MKNCKCPIEAAWMSVQAQLRTCKGIIKYYRESNLPGVKELLTKLERLNSGEFADTESIARIVGIYADAIEQHTMAISTANLRDTKPPEKKHWIESAVLRISIPLKAQFDHWLAMESANKPRERGTEIPPVEQVNRFIALLEQSAALGAPVICHTPEFQLRGHMIFWAAFDAKSATGDLITKEIKKLEQALGEATVWGQVPLTKRILDTKTVGGKRVKKYPRPADYVPPDEFEWRYRWDTDRNYICTTQGRLFNAALPTLKMAWEHQPLLKTLLREAAEANDAD